MLDDDNSPISAQDASRLFAPLKAMPALILAVSGGPDSTALMWLAARWRKALKQGPKLLAVTVDHGLRQNSASEALAVKRLAKTISVAHRTLRWQGDKPANGLPAAAREARYRLLAEAARKHKAVHIVTAHTGDDQAETFLMRLSRGSGLAGLGVMAQQSGRGEIVLVRPFLDIPKSRLVATLNRAGVAFADDPTNRDASFTRPRWRALMPLIAKEGIDARTIVRLASRLSRANAALEAVVDAAARRIARIDAGQIDIDQAAFAELPDEIALRLVGRAVSTLGHEGAVELGKLEALLLSLRAAEARERASIRWKQTLAGATIAAANGVISIAPAPRRRGKSAGKRHSP